MNPDLPSRDAPAAQHDAIALRRARSELERAARLALAGELVAAITHDLRQPLTAVAMNISAALHLLRRPVPRTEEAIAALVDAHEQQRRMRDALQVLQDLSIRRDAFLEMLDPVAVVRDVVRLVGADALARNVPIELDVEALVPAVAGDSLLMRHALLNVVLDALEATSLSAHRDRPVRVSVHKSADDVEIAVSHAGTAGGVAGAEDWSLAVVRSVVETHRATLAVEGSADDGVRVVTHWPTAMPAATVAPQTPVG